MFEKLFSLLSGSRPAVEEKAEGGETGEQKAVPLTTDEALRELVRSLETTRQKEEEEFMQRVQSFSSGQPEAKETTVYTQASNKTEPEDFDVNVPEDASANDVIKAIAQAVYKRISEEFRKEIEPVVKTAVPPTPFLVESVVREKPYLSSVATEAERLLKQLPIQFQTRETAEALLYMLKGMKAEAEKRQAVAEALGAFSETERNNANAVVTLPYSSEELNRWAEQLKIPAERLKTRLLEEMAKGGLQ